MNESKPVTGSWANIIAAVRAMVVAGLCRVDTQDRCGEPCVQIVLGDDSEVRAYYEEMREEREAFRAIGDYRSADNLLCHYQKLSGRVGERPYTLGTNMYGWAMGSHLLANLGGGRFAITNRGATLEQCIVAGCELARVKGTTLTFGALGDSIEDAVDLVRAAGGTDEQVAIVLAAPAREAARAAERAARQAEAETQRVAYEAARQACVKVMEAVRAPYLTTRQRLVDKQTRQRWQVVDIGAAMIKLRRMTYEASPDGMEWDPCYGHDDDTTMQSHRGNLEILFATDED